MSPISLPDEDLTDRTASADCSYSISSNLLGAKLWHLFPPSCTPSLLLIITAAEREGASVDVRDWTSERMAEFSAKGMIVVRQEQGETIFSELRSGAERPLLG